MKKLVFLVIMALVAICAVPASNSHAQSSDLKEVVKQLQLHASDLVRETGFQDMAGAQREYAAFRDFYTPNQAAIKAKSAEAEMRITDALNAVGAALTAGNLDQAKTAAAALLKAVNDAAEPLTGVKSGSVEGLQLVLQELQSAARDLQREVFNKDNKGIQSAVDSLDKLFTSSESQIRDKSPQAATEIRTAIDQIHAATTKGDVALISAAADNLANVVNSASNTLGATAPGMPTTGHDILPSLVALICAALALLVAGRTLRRSTR
ncbi:MAG: hypothetical protein ACR2M0_12625 [Chloroflexia bacterium]